MGGSVCDKICKNILYYLQIMCKRYQHPHLPGKSSAFTRRSEQKHWCHHSVFTYYTICFYRADNIIVLHYAFKSSCQQGNHLSFKILNQIFHLDVCKTSVPVCWITYINTKQIPPHFWDWKSSSPWCSKENKGTWFSEQRFEKVWMGQLNFSCGITFKNWGIKDSKDPNEWR